MDAALRNSGESICTFVLAERHRRLVNETLELMEVDSDIRRLTYLFVKLINMILENLEAKKRGSVVEKYKPLHRKNFQGCAQLTTCLHIALIKQHECSTVKASFTQHFPLFSLISKQYLEKFQKRTNQLPCWNAPSIIQHKIFVHQTAYGDTMFSSMNSENPVKKIKRHNSDDLNNFNIIMKCSKDHVLLLLLALLMMGTLVAASRYAAVHKHPQERQDSVITLLFILCNSTVFVTSLAGVIYLLHEFPFKPWPHITVSMLFVPYILLVFKISPNEALPLLALSIPILLLAAAGKLFGFARERSFSGSGDTYSA